MVRFSCSTGPLNLLLDIRLSRYVRSEAEKAGVGESAPSSLVRFAAGVSHTSRSPGNSPSAVSQGRSILLSRNAVAMALAASSLRFKFAQRESARGLAITAVNWISSVIV